MISHAEDRADQLGPHDAVVLIHGTFARDTRWIRQDSPLMAALRVKFPMTSLQRFEWSGGNSPNARIRAGLELAAFGRSLRSRGCRHLQIISHSHGGNVALYALRDPLMREMVTGIVFLG